MRRRYIYLILLLFFSLCFSCETNSDLVINSNKISDRITIYNCIDANVAVVSSEMGLVIIDTHRSPGIMEKILLHIQNDFKDKKILHIINTHGHYDHCSGNQIFPDSIIIGHENCPVYVGNNPANSKGNLRGYKKQIKKIHEQLSDTSKNNTEIEELENNLLGWQLIFSDMKNRYVNTPPGITFKDSLLISLSDISLRLYYCGNAHTDHDIFIYVPQEKVVFTGDMFMSGEYFGFQVNRVNDIVRVISTMDKILNHKEEIKWIVPIHTEMIPGKDFKNLRNILIKKYEELDSRKSAVLYLQQQIEQHGPEYALLKFKLIEPQLGKTFYSSEKEFNTSGYRLMGKGKYDDAIALFKLHTRMFPKSANAFDNLGEAYLKKGNTEAAIVNYNKSLEIFPANLNAKDILKMLKEK